MRPCLKIRNNKRAGVQLGGGVPAWRVRSPGLYSPQLEKGKRAEAASSPRDRGGECGSAVSHLLEAPRFRPTGLGTGMRRGSAWGRVPPGGEKRARRGSCGWGLSVPVPCRCARVLCVLCTCVQVLTDKNSSGSPRVLFPEDSPGSPKCPQSWRS